MFLITAFALLFFSHFLQSECQNTPFYRSDYKYVKEFDAFYKVHKDKQKWSDAAATCRDEGSELFVPETQKEHDMLKNMANVNRFWIAAHDIFTEGDFATLDGKSFSDKYINWREGEPDNYGDNEDCVVVEENGFHLDTPCERIYAFICKKPAVNITLNHVCESHDPNYKYSIELDRCYKIHSDPLNWHSAFRKCRNEGSYLVIINTKHEAQLLVKLFAKYPESSIKGQSEKNFMFVGFSDLLCNGIFLTIEGETLSEAGYDEWADHQPHHYGHTEHCGSVFRDGSLNAINCLNRAVFVCEKKASSAHKESNKYVIKKSENNKVDDNNNYNISFMARLPDEDK